MAKRKNETEEAIEITENVQEEKQEVNNDNKPDYKEMLIVRDTPYVSEPTININTAGMLERGRVYKIQGEVNNGTNGKFWKIKDWIYVNKACDTIEIFGE